MSLSFTIQCILCFENFNPIILLLCFGVILYLCYWYCTYSWNQMGDLHWTWTPKFVTILSVPISHEHRDSTVVHIEYLPIGLSDNISEATKHVKVEHTPDLSSLSRYFLMMETEKFPKHVTSLVNWRGRSPRIFSCRENRGTEPTCPLCAKTIIFFFVWQMIFVTKQKACPTLYSRLLKHRLWFLRK
jgi:hypothetical protein